MFKFKNYIAPEIMNDLSLLKYDGPYDLRNNNSIQRRREILSDMVLNQCPI